MAHEIEGNYAFFASGKPAWHGLGTVLTDAPSVDEAWRLAYPHALIETGIEAVIGEGTDRATMPINAHKAIIRDDGNFIGIVGKDYHLEQPYEVFKFFDPWIKSGLVDLEAGGSLYDGKRMWALGKVRGSEREVVKGDPVRAYILAATSFDGSLSKLTKFCATRVVCANTLAIARGEDTTEWKTRHTSGMAGRLINVQAAISEALVTHSHNVDAYQHLARRPMSRSQMVAYVNAVIDADNTPVAKRSAQMTTKINTVVDLLDTQRGLDAVPAARGTAWQAYNAVSEYVTHVSARSQDARLAGQWFGGATHDLNARALDLALAA